MQQQVPAAVKQQLLAVLVVCKLLLLQQEQQQAVAEQALQQVQVCLCQLGAYPADQKQQLQVLQVILVV
jgi:hypothetical protein